MCVSSCVLYAAHIPMTLLLLCSQWFVWLLPLFLHADQRPVLHQLGHQSDPLQPGVSHLPPGLLLHATLLLYALPPHTQDALPPPDPPLHQHLQQPHTVHKHHQGDGVLKALPWITLSRIMNPHAATSWFLVQLHEHIMFWFGERRHRLICTGFTIIVMWGHVPTQRPLWIDFRCTFCN